LNAINQWRDISQRMVQPNDYCPTVDNRLRRMSTMGWFDNRFHGYDVAISFPWKG